MRIVDADILSYALLENHIASPYAKPLIMRGLKGELEVNLAITTVLETYNTLYWYYKVRPKRLILEKLEVVVEGLNLVSTPVKLGIRISEKENVPLGDGLLVATALENKIPVIVSNDKHLKRLCDRYGLIYENPIPEHVRRLMS